MNDATQQVFASEEEKYKIVYELSPEAIVILNKTGSIIDANDRLTEWLGYTLEDIAGKRLPNIPFFTLASKGIVIKKFAERMMGKKIEAYDLEFEAKDGSHKVGRINGVLIKNSSGSTVGDLVMISDVTDQRQSQKLLAEKNAELEKLNSAMMGREAKMADMKKEITELKNKLAES